MLPDRVSNPGPLTYESGALPIALRDPASVLSPTLFNIFPERIMTDALEEHEGKVSIGGRNITNLQFANDKDALAKEEQEQ